MTRSTFPPAGAQQPYGQPYGQPGFGAPGAPFGPPAPPFGSQQPPKRKTGVIIGSLVAALLLIGGLVIGAVFLFGTKTLDRADAERQVTQAAGELTGATADDVTCPADVEVQAGSSFTCTASLEGQPTSFTVTQKDDQGDVEISADNTFVPLATVEDDISSQVEAEAAVDVDTTCDAGGRTILVDPAGTELACTVFNAEDPSLSIGVTATVEADGSATIEVEDA